MRIHFFSLIFLLCSPSFAQEVPPVGTADPAAQAQTPTQSQPVTQEDFFNFQSLSMNGGKWSFHTTGSNESCPASEVEKTDAGSAQSLAGYRLLNAMEKHEGVLADYYGDLFFQNPLGGSCGNDVDKKGALYKRAYRMSGEYHEEKMKLIGELIEKNGGPNPDQPDPFQDLDQKLAKAPLTWEGLGTVLLNLHQASESHPTKENLVDPALAESVTMECQLIASGKDSFNYGPYRADGMPDRELIQDRIHSMLNERSNWVELKQIYERTTSAILRGAKADELMQDILVLKAAAVSGAVSRDMLDEWTREMPGAHENKRLFPMAMNFADQMNTELTYMLGNHPHEYLNIGMLTHQVMLWEKCAELAGPSDLTASFELKIKRLAQDNLRNVIHDAVGRVSVLLASPRTKTTAEDVVRILKYAEKLGLDYPEAYLASRKQFGLYLANDEMESFLARAAAHQIEWVWNDASLSMSEMTNEQSRRIYFKALSRTNLEYEERLSSFIDALPPELPLATQEKPMVTLDGKFVRPRNEVDQLETYLQLNRLELLTDMITVDAVRTGPDLFHFTFHYLNPLSGDVDQIEYNTQIKIDEGANYPSLHKQPAHYIVNHEARAFPKLVDFTHAEAKDD